jgi:predicted nucleotidyltransferase
MKNNLSKIEKRVVREFKNELLKKLGRKVVLIELFGSKVRGNAHKGSDVDILVVYKGNGKTRQTLINLEWEFLKKYNYEVYLSVIPYSFQEYQYDSKINTPFIYNLEKEGIVIWNTILSRKS